MVLNRPILDMKLFKDRLPDSLPRPFDIPRAPHDSFSSSPQILLYKSLAWSTALNPRRLENDWIPAWEHTVQRLLDPLSRSGHTFIPAGQRYLWYQDDVEEVKQEAKMRNKQLTREKQIEAEEEEHEEEMSGATGSVEEDIDEAYNPLAEVSFESHHTQAATRSVGRLVTLHEGIPEITVLETSFTQLKYPEHTTDDDASDAGSEVVTKEVEMWDLDELTDSEEVEEYDPPGFSVFASRLTGDEPSKLGPWSPEKILQKLRNKYIHGGGYAIQNCTPRALVELKTLPPRSLVRHRFDTQMAWASFLDGLSAAHELAIEDLSVYAIILFKRYADVQEFLAIAGAGPFWRWAIIHRQDIPWKDPGQNPRNRWIHQQEAARFASLFTNDYFELGTTRSDDELQKLIEVFFEPKESKFADDRAEEAKIRFEKVTKWREAHIQGGDWYWLPRTERKVKRKEYDQELRERQERISKKAGKKH
ncbi:hypothetical protein F5877DRAFT_64902 [Lentinula edodes]|nr:hypothetical protein F5877DRAFT_64902 [Lentinula edodes]